MPYRPTLTERGRDAGARPAAHMMRGSTTTSSRLTRQIVLPLLLTSLAIGIVAAVGTYYLDSPTAALTVAVWAAVGTLAVTAVGILVAGRVTAPLVSLEQGARRVAEGDFSARVDVTGDPELNALGSTFNRMAESLQHHSDSLTKKMLELATLYDTSRSIGGSLDLDELLDSVLATGLHVFDADVGAIAVRDRDSGESRIMAVHELDARSLLEPESAVSWVLREGRPLVHNAGETTVTTSGWCSTLCVPLRAADECVGAWLVGSHDNDRRFDAEDVRLLTIIANQVTMAVGNIELFSSLQDAYLATVRSLAAAIDAKDSYTRGHSDRVAAYATTIAEHMGLPSGERMALEMAAYLHDIGKIGVPESILRKPGRLTDEEFSQMRAHPLIGASILDPIEFPWPITPMVRHHHESFDGRGYPAGLAGDEIPLSARILTVADSYEAMVADRPYRKGREPSSALEELERCSGSQFDPDIVVVFRELFAEGRFDDALAFGALRDVDPEEARDAFAALFAGVVASFSRLGGDRLVANIEDQLSASFSADGLPLLVIDGEIAFVGGADVVEELGAMRAALRQLDSAIEQVSGSALVDHFYADALAGMRPHQRAIAEELALTPNARAVA